MEDAALRGPDVVEGTLVVGTERFPLFGIYIPLSETNLSSMLCLLEQLWAVKGEQSIVVGNLNVSMTALRDKRQRVIVKEVEDLALQDMARRFLLRR